MKKEEYLPTLEEIWGDGTNEGLASALQKIAKMQKLKKSPEDDFIDVQSARDMKIQYPKYSGDFYLEINAEQSWDNIIKVCEDR